MFTRILLAADESEHSQKALDLTAQLASQFGSEVLVLHIREQIATRAGAMDAHVSEGRIADEMASSLKDKGIDARPEEIKGLHGRVAGNIAEAAADYGAELIVMGSRGLSDVAGMFVGSVAHQVLHRAKCPVLITR